MRYGNNQITNTNSKDGTTHHSRKPSTNNTGSTNTNVKKTYPVAPSANYMNLHAGSNNSPRHKKNLSQNSMFTSYHQNAVKAIASRNNRPL